MLINIFLLGSLYGVAFFLIPLILSALLQNSRSLLKLLLWVILLCYLACVAILTLSDVNFSYPNLAVSIIPNEKWFSMNFVVWGGGLFNYLSNLAMFLPLGVFVFGLKERRKFLSTISLALLLSIIIEVLQFILPFARTTELADIILNVSSGFVSATFCLIFYSIKK